MRTRTEIAVTREPVGRRVVLGVSGAVGLKSVHVLAEAVDETIAAGAVELWIDLTDTELMDPSGVALLLDTRKRLDALNRRLAIICPSDRLRSLFEVTGASSRLLLYDARVAAHRAG